MDLSVSQLRARCREQSMWVESMGSSLCPIGLLQTGLWKSSSMHTLWLPLQGPQAFWCKASHCSQCTALLWVFEELSQTSVIPMLGGLVSCSSPEAAAWPYSVVCHCCKQWQVIFAASTEWGQQRVEVALNPSSPRGDLHAALRCLPTAVWPVDTADLSVVILAGQMFFCV